MDSNSRKRSRKSKLVLRQVIELDEELQKILDISQDIQKPDENYLNNALKIEKVENDDLPPEFEEEEETYVLPSTEVLPVPSDTEVEKDSLESDVIPIKMPKLMTQKPEENNDVVINNDHTYSMQETATNIQFSVNIEVEEFDDENIDTDCLNIDESCDYGYRTHEISVRKDLFIDPNNETQKLDLPKHVVNNIIVGKHMIESRIEALPEHIVNSIILGDDYQKHIAPTLTHNEPIVTPIDQTNINPILTPIDQTNENNVCTVIKDPIAFSDELLTSMKEFSISTNRYLKLFAINNYGIHIEDKQKFHQIDFQLELALNTWSVWYRITKNQPLSYKCYTCKKAWWYLYDFRAHLKKGHTNLAIDMEVNDALCNIVAYDKVLNCKLPSLTEIPIKGKCITCNREYNEHLKVTCAGCHFKFATCGIYIKHVGQCKKYILKQDKKPINFCNLCDINFYDINVYEEHFSVMHLVRSDIPIPRSSLSKCRICDLKVPYCKPHACLPSKTAKRKTTCHKCLYRFHNPYILKLHNYRRYLKCMSCESKLVSQCAYLSHLLRHTTEFKNVIKCQICTEFIVFNNFISFKQHVQLEHKEYLKIKDWKVLYAQQVLLPTKLYEKCNGNVNYSMDEDEITTSSTIEKEYKVAKILVHERILQDCSLKQELGETSDENLESNPEPKQKSPKHIIKPPKKTTKRKIKKSSNKNVIKTPKKITEDDTKSSPKKSYEEVLSTIFANGEGGSEGAGEEEALDMVMVKTEIKEEPFDYELFAGSFGMNFLNVDQFDQAITQEPEIIMGEMVLKRTYCCKTCGFIGYHSEYKDHVASKACKKHSNRYKMDLKSSLYRCTKCSGEFHKLKPYILHLTKHGFVLRSCPECLESFTTITKLIPHLQMHIKDLYLRLIFLTEDQMKQNFCYQCRLCKLRITENDFFEHWEGHLEFNLKNELNVEVDLNEKEMTVESESRMESDDSDDPSFVINETQVKAAIQQLQKHKRAFDRVTDMKCGLCGKVFTRKMDHKRHLIEHLLLHAYFRKPSNAGLKCQICGEKFQKADVYKQHMRNHAALPIYRCELCNKSFSDSSNFAKHKKVHNLKVLVCDHCGKKFHQKHTLETHMEIHIKNQFFTCPDCPQKFLTLSKRRKHIRRVHENIKPKFRCMICRKSFHSLKYKWDHEWNAHKERQIKADCPQCGKKFRKISDVKRHITEEHFTNAVLLDNSKEIEITVD